MLVFHHATARTNRATDRRTPKNATGMPPIRAVLAERHFLAAFDHAARGKAAGQLDNRQIASDAETNQVEYGEDDRRMDAEQLARRNALVIKELRPPD